MYSRDFSALDDYFAKKQISILNLTELSSETLPFLGRTTLASSSLRGRTSTPVARELLFRLPELVVAVVGGVVGVVVVVVAHSEWLVSCCFVCLISHVVVFLCDWW